MFDAVHEPAVIGMPSAHTGWGAINPADYFLSTMARAVGRGCSGGQGYRGGPVALRDRPRGLRVALVLTRGNVDVVLAAALAATHPTTNAMAGHYQLTVWTGRHVPGGSSTGHRKCDHSGADVSM